MARDTNHCDQMFEKIGQWQESGLSQKAFCINAGISYHVFHYWYKRFREGVSPVEPSFVPVNFSPSSGNIFASLTFSSGVSLQLHQPVNPDYLKALLF